MPETMNTVRFCEKCGTRTSHDGDECLVCAARVEPDPQPETDA